MFSLNDEAVQCVKNYLQRTQKNNVDQLKFCFVLR